MTQKAETHRDAFGIAFKHEMSLDATIFNQITSLLYIRLPTRSKET